MLLAQTDPYTTSDHFRSGTGDSSPGRVRCFEPGEAARERLILAKLGKGCWGRWQYFRQCFSGAWGEHGQKPLSPRSQEAFFSTLETLDVPEGAKPSLFLTDDGHLELAWRDAVGRAVQIEFGTASSELYLEAEEAEFTVANQNLPALLRERLPRRSHAG